MIISYCLHFNFCFKDSTWKANAEILIPLILYLRMIIISFKKNSQKKEMKHQLYKSIILNNKT